MQAIAAEILETPGSHPACELELRFAWETNDPELRCHDVLAIMQENWPDQRTVQHIHYLLRRPHILQRFHGFILIAL